MCSLCNPLVVAVCVVWGEESLIGNVCQGRGVGSRGESAVCFPFLDPSMVFSITGALGKGGHQGEGPAHMSIMCVILCHRDTPRQCFKSRKLLRQSDTEMHSGGTFPFLLWIYWKRIPYACPPSQEQYGQDIAFPPSSYPTFDSVTVTPYAAKIAHPPFLGIKRPFHKTY